MHCYFVWFRSLMFGSHSYITATPLVVSWLNSLLSDLYINCSFYLLLLYLFNGLLWMWDSEFSALSIVWQISYLWLNRVAEEVIFGRENVTTGASNDFMQVSRVARQMVERFGFSKKIGQVAIGGPGGNPFLGQQVGRDLK